jgi:hypothetical protein
VLGFHASRRKFGFDSVGLGASFGGFFERVFACGAMDEWL